MSILDESIDHVSYLLLLNNFGKRFLSILHRFSTFLINNTIIFKIQNFEFLIHFSYHPLALRKIPHIIFVVPNAWSVDLLHSRKCVKHVISELSRGFFSSYGNPKWSNPYLVDSPGGYRNSPWNSGKFLLNPNLVTSLISSLARLDFDGN